MNPDELIGQTIGTYHLEAILGSGGMSVVYRARRAQEPPVALKLLFPPPGTAAETLARFEREARTAARLRHPGLVPVLETGQAHSRPYLVMTLIEGQTLAQRLAEQGRLAEANAADIAWQLADALYYAHSQGVVHRDLKPSNILLDAAGRAWLTDFGVAQALDDPALTRTGFTVGTPAYMSPEQAAGVSSLDGRSDLYSLGVVLYQMVTGRLPFQGGTPQMLHAHVYEPPPPPSSVAEVSPGMEAIILRAMTKAVEQRYQTGAALAQALDALQDQTSLQLPPAAPVSPPPARPLLRTRRFWISLLTAAAIGLTAWEFLGLEANAPLEPATAVTAASPTAPIAPSPTRPATPTVSLPYPAGTLLKGSGEGVFRLSDSGQVQHVYDFPTFTTFGFSEADIQPIADDALAALPAAGELTRLLQTPDRRFDWVVNGQRWRIGRWQESLAESGYLGLPASPADEALLATLPLALDAAELPLDRVYREGNNLYSLFPGAELRPFQSEDLVAAYGYDPGQAIDLPGEVRHLYHTGPPLTPFLRPDNGQEIYQIVAGQRQPVASEAAVFAQGYGVEAIGRVPAEFLAALPLAEVTATPAPPPAPTEPPPTPTATPCPLAVAEVFVARLTGPLAEAMGCPQGKAELIATAAQRFQQGQMLWRGDRQVIYVLEADGRWSFFGDTWEDGDDPFDPSIIVPEGLYQPVRGFGQVWRDQPGLRASLGYALAEETGFSGTIQPFATGLVWDNPPDKRLVILFNNGTYEVVGEEE